MELKSEPTLDVVIEGAITVAVFVENAESITIGKILKLNQTVHPIPAKQTSVNYIPSYQLSELTL